MVKRVQAGAKAEPVILQRSLAGVAVNRDGVTHLLECVVDDTGLIRALFAAGTEPRAILPDGAPGCAVPQEIRAIGSNTMVVLPGGGPQKLALANAMPLDLDPVASEPALLAGKNCILAFRLQETAAQVAEGLNWHVEAHGLQGAVIVDRAAPSGDDAFAKDLAKALAGIDLTVILVTCPLPLGEPGAGAESHVLFAPDAPGKDRMDRPLPDPWLAPLAESGLHEILKWCFLARARAVLTLDVCDILAAPGLDQPNAFDLCQISETGVILLVGRRIYPWRVRKTAIARFGDHTCRLFDNRRGFARWGVAPEKAGLENTWRARRVAFAKPDAAASVGFYRAMALRIPGRSPSELAPKTALVEDPVLLTLARDHFKSKPVRAPVSSPRAAPRTAAEAGRTVIVTTMKNEGPFILEWLAYHRMIGVDDFLIYTNDCTDGTDTMLDLLQAKGIVQHRANPFRETDLKPQHAALQAAEEEPVIRNCGWGICMDVDEFINVKIGDGTLAALYAAMGEANMISLTWRMFGNAEVHEYKDKPVIGQFTRCAPELIRKPHQAWGFKTLFRNIAIYRKLGVHRPKGLRPDLWSQIHWLNGSGQPLPTEMFRNGWRSTVESYGYDWVQLNHYAVRSAESFLVKRDRGRVNHVDRDQGMNYWFRMNHNVDQDLSIQRMIPRLQQELGTLMSDPEIAAAHAHSVACHRAAITRLRASPEQEKFYEDLTSPRMERACRLQPHFGSAIFAAGPEVIPDDLLTRDLAPDFFFTLASETEEEEE